MIIFLTCVEIIVYRLLTMQLSY